MRIGLVLGAIILSASGLSAQGIGEPQRLGALPRQSIVYPFRVEGLAPVRSDFFSYSTSPSAIRGIPAEEFFFRPVTSFSGERTDSSTIYNAVVDISARWLGRRATLHIEGSRRAHRVWMNGVYVGSSTDAFLPSEFNVTTALREQSNAIRIEVLNASDPVSNLKDERPVLTDVYFYSQPLAHIADYDLTAAIDSLGRGHFMVEAIVENSYNLTKPISVGCIFTTLDGHSAGYIPVEKYIDGNTTGRIEFDVIVDKPKLWTPASPTLYKLTLYVKYMGQIVEYVPINGAFRGELMYDETPEITPFNSTDRTSAIKQIAALKKRGGVLILGPDAPQPTWFYDACDSIGMLVIDCANIYAAPKINDAPEFAAEFERRVEAMYLRSRNHPCILFRRIGNADVGTSYALWRATLRLDALTF